MTQNNLALSELYNGIGIIFDDELIGHDPDLEVSKIVAQINQRGIPLIERYDLPDTPCEIIKHLKNISFVILDWEFVKIDDAARVSGVRIGDDIIRQYRERVICFISELLQTTFCPIFIFSQEDPSAIKTTLEDKRIIGTSGHPRIFIKRKSGLLDDRLFDEIENWLKSNLSVYVMKKWDHEHTRSKIALFNSYEKINHAWPKVMWASFKADGVIPEDKLSALLFRSLQASSSPFSFSQDLFDAASLDALSRGDIRKVISGERMLPKFVLNDSSLSPGDLFLDCRKLYVNIRPACDCISRSPGDDIILYLLQGNSISEIKESQYYDQEHGHLKEIDCQSIVFALHNGKSYDFRFKKLEQKSWNEWREKRIGRLLPPYITRIQQRYAAYIQREGMPRIPQEAISSIVETSCTQR